MGSRPRSSRAFSLLEVALCLALFSLLALGIWTGVEAIAGGAHLQAGRIDLVLFLAQARRLAYLGETAIVVTAAEGTRNLTLAAEGGPDLDRTLPAGLVISDAPSRGGVRFHASGWAENGTFELSWSDGLRPGREHVIINQRGRIR